MNKGQDKTKKTKNQQGSICYRCFSAYGWFDICMDNAS